jgi:hypothetical protein
MDFSKEINLVKEWATVAGLVAEPIEDEIGGGVGLHTPETVESTVTVSFGGLSGFGHQPHRLEDILISRFTNAVKTLRAGLAMEAAHAPD